MRYKAGFFIDLWQQQHNIFMRFFKKAKPLLVKNMQEALLGEIYPDKILFVCKMRVLDRVIYPKLYPNDHFSEAFADRHELHNSFFYFIVLNDLRYGTLPAHVFQPWLAFMPERPAPGATFFADVQPKDGPAKDCFHKYINYCLNN